MTLHANSRPVSSNQRHLHPRLAATVTRHLGAPYRRPVADHSRAAYSTLRENLALKNRPLVVDSFCGTGHSTELLSRRFPDHLVVGIDKSAQRLGKHPSGNGENYCLLHADCEDIWQLMVSDGLVAAHHFILYPNPWPKAKHLQRRVHGHGSLPLLPQLGGAITLRSNWQIYVEEFGLAMHLAGRRGVVSRIAGEPPMTLFEQKYRDSGHTLWQFQAGGSP
mgnify:FL=1